MNELNADVAAFAREHGARAETEQRQKEQAMQYAHIHKKGILGPHCRPFSNRAHLEKKPADAKGVNESGRRHKATVRAYRLPNSMTAHSMRRQSRPSDLLITDYLFLMTDSL